MMIQESIIPADIVDDGVQEDGYILVSEQLSSQDEEDISNKSTSSKDSFDCPGGIGSISCGTADPL